MKPIIILKPKDNCWTPEQYNGYFSIILPRLKEQYPYFDFIALNYNLDINIISTEEQAIKLIGVKEQELEKLKDLLN